MLNVQNIPDQNDEELYSLVCNIMQFVCLYEFAAWHIKCPASSQGRVTSRMQERIYIPTYDIWMRHRKHSAVVRYPAFSASCDVYYYSLL